MDDRDPSVPGARDVTEVLASDPGYRLLGLRLTSPVVLGLTIAVLIVLMILFGPLAESRFIYTDF